MDTQFRPQPYGIGLLATVTSLPSYHFNTITTNNTSSKAANTEIPLDLSKKVTTTTTITSASPLKKRYREVEFGDNDQEKESEKKLIKLSKTELTPNKPISKTETVKNNKNHPPTVAKTNTTTATASPKRTKVSRKLKFDEDKSSPVSGTIIRPLEEINGNIEHESGDIDPQYNIVEATEEARAEIAAIPNVIGDYKCKLCRIDFEDVFELARHRCSCIVLLEYRCPECGKKFNCPANLASHRRWHKPRDQATSKKESTSSSLSSTSTTNDENQYPCDQCGKSFKRMAYLKKHQATHQNPKKSSKQQQQPIVALNHEDSSKDSHYSQISSTSKNLNNNVVLYPSSYSSSSHRSSSSMSDIVYTISATTSTIPKHHQHHPHRSISDESEDSCDSSDSQRLHIISDHRFTEDENIAAAALAHLRHGSSSVIKHTTALTV